MHMSMKKLMDSKTIETELLKVRGDLIIWQNTMIQISNIAMISTDDILGKPFPIWSAIILFLGAIIIGSNKVIGISLILLGGIWIAWWYKQNQQRKEYKMLNFLLNSGDKFSLVFYDQDFLKKVTTVLRDILAENRKDAKVTFNIKDSQFVNSSVISTLNDGGL